jgi:hypothetical protein
MLSAWICEGKGSNNHGQLIGIYGRTQTVDFKEEQKLLCVNEPLTQSVILS